MCQRCDTSLRILSGVASRAIVPRPHGRDRVGARHLDSPDLIRCRGPSPSAWRRPRAAGPGPGKTPAPGSRARRDSRSSLQPEDRRRLRRVDPPVHPVSRQTPPHRYGGVEGNVAASTQNQALSALLFMYRDVLEVELPWLDGIVRAKRPQRLPVVLTRDEVRAVLRRLEGAPRLMAYLLYGAGLRLLECCRLRVQDVDFASNQIVVRGGKGDKDRMTMLPAVIKPDLARHLESVREQYRRDVECGAGWVELPTALARKYPNAGREVGVALGLPGDPHVRGAAHRPAAPTSSARIRPAARRQARRLARGHREARARTRCATHSPRTCSRRGATSGPSRSCSGIVT